MDEDTSPDQHPDRDTGSEQAMASGPADTPSTSGHDPTGLGLAKAVAGAVSGTRRSRRPRGSSRSDQPPTDPRLAGAHPDDRDPQPLGTAMDRFVDAHGWSTEISLRILLGKWPSLVGSVNAAHSTPVGYHDSILEVQAESTVWATSLRAIAPQLVGQLNSELGADTVTRIDVRGPQAPSWKKGRRSVRDGRGPRDTYG